MLFKPNASFWRIGSQGHASFVFVHYDSNVTYPVYIAGSGTTTCLNCLPKIWQKGNCSCIQFNEMKEMNYALTPRVRCIVLLSTIHSHGLWPEACQIWPIKVTCMWDMPHWALHKDTIKVVKCPWQRLCMMGKMWPTRKIIFTIKRP